jgi:ribosomal protein S24E
MKIEVTEKKENPLLSREEIRFRATYEGATPKVQDIRKELLAALKSDEKLTVLDTIKTEYGAKALVGYVKVYADAAGMKIERESKARKNFGGEKKEKKKKEAPKKKEEKK